MSCELAIVLAAYKPDFLSLAVESVCNQTDKRFQLYIFDDCSPHDLADILSDFDPSLFHYHRFEENFGGTSVVQQWKRCIEHTEDEPWVWIFSDDDIMDANCVEKFYHTKSIHPNYSTYRFDTKKISGNGTVLRENRFPDVLQPADFLNLKLAYKQECYIVETIFSRDVYNKIGGIPDMPLAWASDDMFNVQLAQNGGICRIGGATVSWRYSGKNISAEKSQKTSIQKLKASRKFVHWIYKQDTLKHQLTPVDLPVRWYVRQVRSLQTQLSTASELTAVIQMARIDWRVWQHYLRMRVKRSKIIGWLKKFFL